MAMAVTIAYRVNTCHVLCSTNTWKAYSPVQHVGCATAYICTPDCDTLKKRALCGTLPGVHAAEGLLLCETTVEYIEILRDIICKMALEIAVVIHTT